MTISDVAVPALRASLVAGGFSTFAIVFGAVLAFSVFFTRYYQDRFESELFPTIVTVIGLTVCLATLCLVPVDIFLVSSTVNPSTGLRYEWATKENVASLLSICRSAYYVLYSVIAGLCFIVIPFAYFYYEEFEEEQTTRDRVWSSIRYTLFTFVIIVILLITGLLLRPKSFDEDPELSLDWFKKFLTESSGEKSITFVIAVLMLLGMLIYITYTAYGLSALPFGLIKSTKSVRRDIMDITNRLTNVRDQIRDIQSKYERAGSTTISARDQKKLESLEREERKYVLQASYVEGSTRGCWNKTVALLRPFEFLFGIACLLLTLCLFLSMFLTIIDKAKNSICGRKCGYILDHPDIFNPVNVLSVNLSKYFPLDYIFTTLIIFYFFFATVSGLVRIGVRFLWLHLFSIRKKRTTPQALLFACIILMLSLLGLNYTMVNVVAPEYSMFGAQRYCNHTTTLQNATTVRDCSQYPSLIIPCSISAPPGKLRFHNLYLSPDGDDINEFFFNVIEMHCFSGPVRNKDLCTPTALSTLINRITINTPFFGVVYYYSQWVFLGVFVLGFTYEFIRSRKSRVDDISDDEYDEMADEWFEKRGQRSGSVSNAGGSAAGNVRAERRTSAPVDTAGRGRGDGGIDTTSQSSKKGWKSWFGKGKGRKDEEKGLLSPGSDDEEGNLNSRSRSGIDVVSGSSSRNDDRGGTASEISSKWSFRKSDRGKGKGRG
ncbi:hypothetical protein BKA69DRAFT_902986 [Paraphysoderma sedebokerense]|nr:hypothetical protein BKA69DRAFT_902986 [Paraphysoderma sedebokerense]